MRLCTVDLDIEVLTYLRSNTEFNVPTLNAFVWVLGRLKFEEARERRAHRSGFEILARCCHSASFLESRGRPKMMREGGVEPPHRLRYRILNPARLPVSPLSLGTVIL